MVYSLVPANEYFVDFIPYPVNSAHVVIDLETLDTKPSAAVIAVAAVAIDPDKRDIYRFYYPVTLDSNLKVGRTINGDTLGWWMRLVTQSPEAAKLMEVVSLSGEENNHYGLEHVLIKLAAWLKELMTDKSGLCVWGNGADFDIAILNSAFAGCGLDIPWYYGNVRCLRTLRFVSGFHDKWPDYYDTVKPMVPHHALYDALAEALWLDVILDNLNHQKFQHAD